MAQPTPRRPVRPALRTWAIATVLLAGTILLFSRVLAYGFINYDDPRYILNNPHVRAGLAWDSIVWAFTGRADYWHPLTWISHMLDWQLYGEAAGGHHLTSVFWHAINAILAFFVFRRLTGAEWTSALAAALFAWHPLRVESVAWITERKDVMSGTFFLLTLWAYAAYAERRRDNRRAWPAYALTLGLFLGGLMAKPSLVTLPAVLWLLDYWPLCRAERTSRIALAMEKIPFCVLSVAIAIVTVAMQRDSGAFTLHLPLGARAGNAAVSVVRYVAKFFWPSDLAIIYPHPGWWPAWQVLGAVLLIVAVTAGAWWQRRQRPWLVVGWLWFLVMLLPSIGLVQVGPQAMADRYTYLATLGIELALLWTLRDWTSQNRWRWILASLGVVALAGGAARTWQQEALWRDPLTLYRHATAVTVQNDVAHAYLGYTLLGLHRLDEAAREAQLAGQIAPRNTVAHYTLALVRSQQGQLDAARTEFRATLEIDPNDVDAAYQLGALLAGQGKLTEAAPYLQIVARNQPGFVASQLALATVALQHGQPEAARAKCRIVFALEPNQPGALYLAGESFAQQGLTEAALATFQELLRQQPRHAAGQAGMGRLLLDAGQIETAAEHFRAALAADPNAAGALYGLARAEEQLGAATEAAAHYERAATLAPDDPLIVHAWAQTLARQHRFGEAAIQLRRAVQLRARDAGLHAEYGYDLLLSGQRAEAAEQWEMALQLDPSLPGLRERLERLRP